MGYDLIPKKEGVEAKSGMIFTWPIILDKTGAVPPSVEFLQKVEALADFFEQSEGFNIL